MIQKEKFSLRGLKQCLKRFDEDGRYAKYGLWSIGRGGYDLEFELYYVGSPVIDCVCHELEIVNNYDKCNIDAVIKKILEVYPDTSYTEKKDED